MGFHLVLSVSVMKDGHPVGSMQMIFFISIGAICTEQTNTDI